MLTLDAQIESILFLKAEPMTKGALAKILKKDNEEIDNALVVLGEKLETRGLILMKKDNKVMLTTSPAMSATIENLRQEELSKDLGKAGLETLSIILYRSPIARAEIDYLRGVNSTFILRNLLIRGLIEKKANPRDQRSYLYQPTFELFSFLGISQINDLPEYAKIKDEIKNFKTIDEEEKEEFVEENN